MTPAIVAATGIVARYGRTVALDGLDLYARGEVVALLGPNGAGKSTLLRCLATARLVDGGELTIDGRDPRTVRDREVIRSHLGYLPQRPAFAGAARVFDVVDYLAICKGHHDERRRHTEVRRVLDAVGMADAAGDRVRTLSGGRVQRVALAQALVGRPSLLVLDEPSTGLDPEQRLVLRSQLSAATEHATVVVSTHSTDDAAVSAQRVVVLDGGRILAAGTPAELAARARGRAWLSSAPPPPGTSVAWRTSDGRWRSLGAAPPGGVPAEPTLEDAYLLAVGARGGPGSAAGSGGDPGASEPRR